MDILKNKETKEYNYLSRYSSAYFYYNTEDDKYMYGLTKQLSSKTQYTLHNIKETDDLDYLSNYYYGRPDYFWVIADFNRIQDPFIKLSDYFTTIKIPSLTGTEYLER